MEEKWAVIPGFSDYEISTEGNIRSIDRVKSFKSGRVMHLKGKMRKMRVHPSNDYRMTDLIDDKGKLRTVYIHKAVAEAFLPNPQPKKNKVVIHLDGDVSNNKLANLTWTTHKDACKIAFKRSDRDMKKLWDIRREKYGPSGTLKRMGKPDPLSDADKLEIHRLRTKENVTMQKLADQYKCSVSHIFNTLRKLESDKLEKSKA
jgi:hypothetical protein